MKEKIIKYIIEILRFEMTPAVITTIIGYFVIKKYVKIVEKENKNND